MEIIQNTVLKIGVQNKGAELCSIISLKSGKEFMWDANPAIWNSFSPVLFPIIGGLKKGEFFHKGNSYSIPKHGFIRNNEHLKSRIVSNNCIEYSLLFDSDSLKNYPFEFEFFVRYILDENTIIVEHEVVNHASKEEMYFSLGGHPAFKCPLNQGEIYEDYYLEFEYPETIDTWNVLNSGLIDLTSRPLLENSNRLKLHSKLFDNDALILKNLKSKKVTLKNTKSNDAVSLEFSDFPYLGIWAKPGGEFICIEPWLGISDSCDSDQNIETKEGILKLEAKSNFKASYRISIEE